MESEELIKLLVESLKLSTATLKAFMTAYTPKGEAGRNLASLIRANEKLIEMVLAEL